MLRRTIAYRLELSVSSPARTAYDAAVEVTRAAGHVWNATLAQGWDVAGVPNGGYVLAVALRPLLAALDVPDPLTVTAHYLAPAAPGAVQVHVDPVKVEGRHRTAAGALHQDGRELLRLLATATDLARASGPRWVSAQPPAMPPPEECVPAAPVGEFRPPPITQRVEIRIHPAHVGFALGQPTGTAEIAGWVRFADGREPDTTALVLFADALPPPLFNLELPGEWVPTLELTVHVRARPAPGWLRAVFRSRVVEGGYLDEDGELWDSSDRLVALSRQLALVPCAA